MLTTLLGKALILESTLAKIPTPDRMTLKAFRINFFHGRPEESKDWPILGGHSSNLYEDPDDLLVLHTTEPPDRLTIFAQDNLGFFFRVSIKNYSFPLSQAYSKTRMKVPMGLPQGLW